MATITLQVSESALATAAQAPDNLVHELRLAVASYLYRRGDVSMSQAGKIAGMDRLDWMQELARHREDVFVVDINDLKNELARA